MVLVVFLLAYLIRRRLDAVNRGVSEPVWRAWFQWGRVSRPGREHGIGRGLLLILVPAVAAGALEYLMRRAGLSLAVYPLEVLVLLLLMVLIRILAKIPKFLIPRIVSIIIQVGLQHGGNLV